MATKSTAGVARAAATTKTAATKTTTTKATTTKSSSTGLTNAQISGSLSALSGITKSLGELAKLIQAMDSGTTSGSAPGLSGNRTDASYVEEKRSGTSNTGKKYIEGKLVSDVEFNDWIYGKSTTGGGSTATTSSTELSKADRDAFALLSDAFKAYGLESLVPEIQGYMQNNIGPEEAKIMLKQTAAYKTRFAGNEARYKAGLNVLSEADYLGMEDSYSRLLKQYGQQSLATKAEFATLIGADVSATELNSRLNMAVNRVQYADPKILAALKTYYPGITDTDLVGYFLAPDKKLPELEQKVTVGEISAAAQQYGLTAPTLAGAQELAALGVDQTAARTGYQNVAAVLPGASKLSEIYDEANINYNQTTAESEFLKGNASAQRKRRQLAELEQAAFGGQSGVSTTGAGALAKASTGTF